jgi:hypothetical protein
MCVFLPHTVNITGSQCPAIAPWTLLIAPEREIQKLPLLKAALNCSELLLLTEALIRQDRTHLSVINVVCFAPVAIPLRYARLIKQKYLMKVLTHLLKVRSQYALATSKRNNKYISSSFLRTSLNSFLP